MEKDTIVRAYSMSKVISSVAVMILHEEGRLKLTDPVGKYLPALEKMKVYVQGSAKKPTLVDAKRQMTVKDLLTHTSGLIYGFGNGPIDEIYRDAKALESSSMDDFVQRVCQASAGVPAGRAIRLRPQHRRARRDRREGLGHAVRALRAGARDDAARHGGHGVRRARGQARAPGEGLHHEQGRRARRSARDATGGRLRGAGARIRRRRRRHVHDDWPTTRASGRCC